MKTSLESTLDKVGKILARKGINVVCRGNSCHTDGKTITLPSLPEEIPVELERALNGFLDHESSHILNSRFEIIRPFKEAHGNHGFDILNIIEDARVNQVIGSQYIGAGMNIKSANDYVHQKLSAAGTSHMSQWQKFATCLCTRVLSLDSGIFDAEINSVVDMLSEELSEIPCLKSTQDSAALAERILVKLFPPKQEESQEAGEPEPQQSEEQPPQEKGDTNNGEPSSQPPPAEQPQQEQEAESGGNESEGAEDNPDDTAQGEPEQQETPKVQPKPGRTNRQARFLEKCKADETAIGETMATLIEQEINAIASSQTWRVYDPTLDKVIRPKPMDDSVYRVHLEAVKPYISGLRQKLMLTLKARKACRWIGDQEEGHINPQRLTGLITGTSSKVFKIKHEDEAKSVACSLLVDHSGSMRGSRLDLSMKISIAFAETLAQLNIPSETIGFGTSTRPERYFEQAQKETGMSPQELMERFTRFIPLYITVYKEFNETFKTARGRFPKMSARGLTPLHESMMFAARRLAVRPEARKILFVLTDGYPELWPEQTSMIDEAIKTVEQLSNAGIEIIGIGIQSSCVEEIFPQHVVINELEDLPRGFFRQLTKALAA